DFDQMSATTRQSRSAPWSSARSNWPARMFVRSNRALRPPPSSTHATRPAAVASSEAWLMKTSIALDRSFANLFRGQAEDRRRRHLKHVEHQVDLPAVMHLVLDQRAQPFPRRDRYACRRMALPFEVGVAQAADDRLGFGLPPIETRE